MKQILQNLKDGTTELVEVPAPKGRAGHLLIATTHSLISPGTERMLMEFGKANLVHKARQQPDKVRMVFDKVRTDGLGSTFEAVRHKLDQPVTLGYCNVGRVLNIGEGVSGFTTGDRVASNGKHAEVVIVPLNLIAKIPDQVSDEDAAFTVIGAIALQGIRLVAPTLGETVVVTGLGLIGLLTVQLLKAHGCRVLGIDIDPIRLALAESFGAETVNAKTTNPETAAEIFSHGQGVDAVLITASTKSSEPIRQAAHMCRKRGRIVLVGVTGLTLSRADFFEKELSFQVSCSYGPGRYDPEYEDKGHDYPVGFVRWTQQRNFEAVLQMMAEERLNLAPLISHQFKLADAPKAYEVVGGTEPSLGILLTYPTIEGKSDEALLARKVPLASNIAPVAKDVPRIAFIGAGNYATAMLIPVFKSTGAELVSIVSNNGASAVHAARKFGFSEASSDIDAVLADERIDALVISTRHDSHAHLVLKALSAGKHIFVEKPICLTLDELEEIQSVYTRLSKSGTAPLLMVGFNRRFAPYIVQMKKLILDQSTPQAFVMTINAGAIDAKHWTQDRHVGGGRIIGEACHFIDLLRHLAGAPITSWHRIAMNSPTNDTLSLQLGFANGTIGTVHYFANGNKKFPKERLEVFCGGHVMQMNNFRSLMGYGWPGLKNKKSWQQDKGQKTCAAAFVEALHSGRHAPIAIDEIFEVSRISIMLSKTTSMAKTGQD